MDATGVPSSSNTDSMKTDKIATNDEQDRKGPDSPQEPSTSTSGNFECNICLEPATDAVVSRCGHLFCWPCLHQWIEVKKLHAVCPVCKAAISRDSVSG